MSEPKIEYTLDRAQQEIMSCLSSLHMDPVKVPLEEQDKDVDWLDENYIWGRHAREHAMAACQIIGEVRSKLEKLAVDLLLVQKKEAAFDALMEMARGSHEKILQGEG